MKYMSTVYNHYFKERNPTSIVLGYSLYFFAHDETLSLYIFPSCNQGYILSNVLLRNFVCAIQVGVLREQVIPVMI